MLRKFFRAEVAQRFVALLLIGAPGSLAALAGAGAAETGLLHLRCTNSTGGASWQIVVDLDHGLVDALPATITATSISWRDQKGGVYEFARTTGKLQLRGASSTGGYFLHYTCVQE